MSHPSAEREQRSRGVLDAIETLRHLGVPTPLVTDDVERWLPARAARAMKAHGLRTLADLTVRVPRRRRWWSVIPGLGATGARQVEAFFAAHPQLTASARALVPIGAQQGVVPWEKVCVPSEVDGSKGTFRAPNATSTLDANNDYEAVQAWLSLHESAATQRAYRKEAERLILWPWSSAAGRCRLSPLRMPWPIVRSFGTRRRGHGGSDHRDRARRRSGTPSPAGCQHAQSPTHCLSWAPCTAG